MTDGDDILDSVFHGCALRAYLEVWARTGQFPPDSEATRRLAYQYYEQELAEKNRRKQPKDRGRTPQREAGPGCEAPEGAVTSSQRRRNNSLDPAPIESP